MTITETEKKWLFPMFEQVFMRISGTEYKYHMMLVFNDIHAFPFTVLNNWNKEIVTYFK